MRTAHLLSAGYNVAKASAVILPNFAAKWSNARGGEPDPLRAALNVD